MSTKFTRQRRKEIDDTITDLQDVKRKLTALNYSDPGKRRPLMTAAERSARYIRQEIRTIQSRTATLLEKLS